MCWRVIDLPFRALVVDGRNVEGSVTNPLLNSGLWVSKSPDFTDKIVCPTFPPSEGGKVGHT